MPCKSYIFSPTHRTTSATKSNTNRKKQIHPLPKCPANLTNNGIVKLQTRNICAATASTSGAPTASAPSTWARPWGCSSPAPNPHHPSTNQAPIHRSTNQSRPRAIGACRRRCVGGWRCPRPAICPPRRIRRPSPSPAGGGPTIAISCKLRRGLGFMVLTIHRHLVSIQWAGLRERLGWRSDVHTLCRVNVRKRSPKRLISLRWTLAKHDIALNKMKEIIKIAYTSYVSNFNLNDF